MDNALFIVTLVSLVIIALLIIGLLIIFYQFLKYKTYIQHISGQTPRKNEDDITVDSRKIETNVKDSNDRELCSIHNNRYASGTCSICGDFFCDSCLKRHKGLIFCKKHLELFLGSEWEEIISIHTSSDISNSSDKESERSVKLVDLKQEIWNNKKIPTYIQTVYKIKIENDQIESYMTLFGRKNDKIFLKNVTNFLSEVIES